eukprot:g2942.t1
MRWALSTGAALAYLHGREHPIIHRDLKPLNMFLTKDLEVKIGDFGLAKVMPSRLYACTDQAPKMSGGVGTWRYMAPEVVRYEQYDEKVDIYAFSLIIYFIFSGRQPFYSFGKDPRMILRAYRAGEEPRPSLNSSVGTRELRRRVGMSAAAFSPDASKVLASLYDGSADLYARTGERICTCAGHTAPLRSCIMSPDGKMILTASKDGASKLFCADTGACRCTFQAASDAALCSAKFSPDLSKVLTAGQDGTARLFDARTGACLQEFPDHAAPVLSATLSIDGTLVLTSSSDLEAKLFDAKTGNRLQNVLRPDLKMGGFGRTCGIHLVLGHSMEGGVGDMKRAIEDGWAVPQICQKLLCGGRLLPDSARCEALPEKELQLVVSTEMLRSALQSALAKEVLNQLQLVAQNCTYADHAVWSAVEAEVWDCLQIPPILGSDTQDARDAAAAVLLDGALVAWLARGFDHER